LISLEIFPARILRSMNGAAIVAPHRYVLKRCPTMIKKKSTHRFVAPTELSGEWSDCRGGYFWHDKAPVAVKQLVEKMTGTLLRRDSAAAHGLSYGGAARGGSELQAVWLRLEAVIGTRYLYGFVVKRASPRKWVSKPRFSKLAKQTFVVWCSSLRTPSGAIAWHEASPELLEQATRAAIARESAAANVLEYPAPGAARRQEAAGEAHPAEAFFTAHKESGTSLIHDGQNFLHDKHDAAAIDCMRGFFDWDLRHGLRPQQPAEGDSWQNIVNQLVTRNG
jgi:hypothetical protein